MAITMYIPQVPYGIFTFHTRIYLSCYNHCVNTDLVIYNTIRVCITIYIKKYIILNRPAI